MTNHWTSLRTFSQESQPPPGLAISTTVPFYDDSFRCHAGRLPDVDMATGGNEASLRQDPHFFFFAFAAHVFEYLEHTPINNISGNQTTIRFFSANLIRCLLLWMEESLFRWINLAHC